MDNSNKGESILEIEFQSLKDAMDRPITALLQELEELVKKADTESEFVLECRILTYVGRAYRLQNDAYKSINSLNKAYIICNSHLPNNKDVLSDIYRELGNVYANSLEDFLTSIDYNFKGYNLNNERLNPTFLNNIGSNYMSLKQFQNAIKFFDKGISLSIKNEETNLIGLAYLHHNYGEVSLYLGEYETALKYLDVSRIYCERFIAKTNDLVDISNCDYIYGYSFMIKAEVYFRQNLLAEANAVLDEGKEFCARQQQYQPLSGMYLLEGKILLKSNQKEAYNKLFKESIKFCEDESLLNDKQIWLENKLDLLEANKEYKEAFYISKEISENQEVIKSNHKEFNISQILVSKEQEILELENKNRIMQLQKDELKQFAYIVTHDLKTPLSNISNFTGLFRKKYQDKVDDKGKEYLEYIIGSATHLTTMLSDLLQYISFEKGDDNSFEFCNAEKVFTAVAAKNEIPKTHYNVNLVTNDKVPIRAFHLEILLDNLIRNSIKFKSVDVPLQLSLSIKKNENEFLFEVEDNGIGVEDQYKSQIFEIFKRLNKNKSTGTGIGLSICKKIVQSYMGNIWVEDNKDSGCNFKFTIANRLN